MRCALLLRIRQKTFILSASASELWAVWVPRMDVSAAAEREPPVPPPSWTPVFVGEPSSPTQLGVQERDREAIWIQMLETFEEVEKKT